MTSRQFNQSVNEYVRQLIAHGERSVDDTGERGYAIDRDTSDDKYNALRFEAMRGAGAFWPSANEITSPSQMPAFDGEQWLPIFSAVHRAIAAIGLTAEERYSIIHEATMKEIEEYAEIRSDE